MTTDNAKSVPDEASIRNLLRRVVDPEVGMNIVDLGLVYRIEATPQRVLVEMTMTSPACPLGEMITDEVKDVLARAAPPGCATDIRLVWEPPWQQSMMSEAGKRHFGWEAPPMADLRPVGRLPLLVLGMLSLLGGVLAGLARLDWGMPPVAASAAGWHGVLMISAFLGTVISLERAVALGRGWAYAAPAAAGIGGVTLLAGAPLLVPQLLGIVAASLLVAASALVLRRLVAPFTLILAIGALCWLVGNGVWLAGEALHLAVPWWLAFLVLTIAGERLELNRFLPTPRVAQRLFFAIVATVIAGALASLQWEDAGLRLFAAGLLALAAWLLRYDIARRNSGQPGLTGFIAHCLLAGYAWLALAGLMGLAGGFLPGHPWRDATLHAVTLGFVFSMIFGHAPIIFPAVMRVKIPYHPTFYLPLLVLHASLALRIVGGLDDRDSLRSEGGLINAIALLLFILTLLGSALRGRREKPGAAVMETGAANSPAVKSTRETVLAIHHWTPSLLSFRITRPDGFRFTPGHYTRLGLGSTDTSLGDWVWRPYSLTSARDDASLEFIAVLVPGGAFSERLQQLRVGDMISVDKACYGFLTVNQLAPGRDLWLLASGTGLGPFMSILRDPSVWQNWQRLILVHSVRQPAELAWREEMASLPRLARPVANGTATLSYIPIVTREPGATALAARIPALLADGRLEAAAGTALDLAESRLMVCGNPELAKELRQFLTERGYATNRRGVPGQMAFEKYW